MFAVGNILISDDLLDAPFACNLGACHGACCVQGDSGAPLQPEERQHAEEALGLVRHRLRPEALRVIKEKGAWEEVSPGEYATTCVGKAECVFVVYEGPVAKCSIQQAHQEGKTEFPKPISCHLYPIRIEDLGEYDALNYERIDICNAAIRKGRKDDVGLPEFLKGPLERLYGAAWYADFIDACKARREALTT